MLMRPVSPIFNVQCATHLLHRTIVVKLTLLTTCHSQSWCILFLSEDFVFAEWWSTLCAVSDRLLNPPEWRSLNWALPACSAKSGTSINPLIGALAIVRRRGKEQGFAHCCKLWIRVANVNAWLGSSVVSSEVCVLLL